MCEKVAVEGGILLQQGLEIEGALRRDQLIQPHLVWSDGGPLLLDIAVVRVGAGVADTLEDHSISLATLRDNRPIDVQPGQRASREKRG